MGWGFKSLPGSQYLKPLTGNRRGFALFARLKNRPGYSMRVGLIRSAVIALGILSVVGTGYAEGRRFPNILVLSVDTLRYDRLSIHGYDRPTSPHIDNLMRNGVRFEQARTVEPLTAPSMASVFTSLYPHDHGASRNGLRMRPELPSWPQMLGGRGYKVAAFVGNWTLRNELLGLGEHFGTYEEVLNRKRWGIFLGEATAGDLNAQSLNWLETHLKNDGDWPFLLWVHYVEPHAPYRYWSKPARRLGIKNREKRSDRYDTEVAFVDNAIGELLSEVLMRVPSEDLLVIFLSDHGESLGEHGYWGHGRNLHDVGLRVPLGMMWRGKVPANHVVDAPASLLDIGPTILGLLGLPVPNAFDGHDWSPQLLQGAEEPLGRTTFHQAHKGAVKRRRNTQARRLGLLEVGIVKNAVSKEILRVKNEPPSRSLFDLNADPDELRSPVAKGSEPSDELREWLNRVRVGLEASDELPPPSLDQESLDQLRALGYIE